LFKILQTFQNHVVFFLFGDSPAPQFYPPTFRNSLLVSRGCNVKKFKHCRERY